MDQLALNHCSTITLLCTGIGPHWPKHKYKTQLHTVFNWDFRIRISVFPSFLVSDFRPPNILITPSIWITNPPAKEEQTVPTVLVYHFYATNFSDHPFILSKTKCFTQIKSIEEIKRRIQKNIKINKLCIISCQGLSLNPRIKKLSYIVMWAQSRKRKNIKPE